MKFVKFALYLIWACGLYFAATQSNELTKFIGLVACVAFAAAALAVKHIADAVLVQRKHNEWLKQQALQQQAQAEHFHSHNIKLN